MPISEWDRFSNKITIKCTIRHCPNKQRWSTSNIILIRRKSFRAFSRIGNRKCANREPDCPFSTFETLRVSKEYCSFPQFGVEPTTVPLAI